MKKYYIKIVITEQSDEWFKEITKGGNTGCDDVLTEVKNKLQLFDADIKLVKYIDYE